MKKILIVDVPDGGELSKTIDVFFPDSPEMESGIGFTEFHPPTNNELIEAERHFYLDGNVSPESHFWCGVQYILNLLT